MNRQERIRDLEGKIVAVCMACPHVKWVTGRFQCTVKRSHCHSQRVRRWLAELKELEAKT